MKKISLLILIGCLFIMVSCDTISIPEADVGFTYLTWNGHSNYRIIISNDAEPVEVTAAEELQKYIRKIAGAEIRIYRDNKVKAGGSEIIIGKTNRENDSTYTIDRDSLGIEGFNIKFYNNSLVIAGGSGRGTLYGVYDFLEELGCLFVSADAERVPEKNEILLDLSMNITEKPAFEYRDLFWTCSYDENLSAKLRLNGSLQSGKNGRVITEKYGNGVEYAGPMFVHTFNYLIPVEEYYDSHPEYFAEINGKRIKSTSHQLCLTNENVLQIVIEKVKTWLRENPNAKIVSVSQNDSGVIESYCTCEKCRQINNKEERSPAGTLIRFVNAVADGIKDEFPDVAVDTLAFQFSVTPPSKTKPRDNVIVRYCTGGCSAHPYGECSNNLGVKSEIVKWSKMSNRIYVWDYTIFFSKYLSPYLNFDVLQPNIQFFYENNVKGVFAQGNYQEGENGEFGELRCYLLAKLLWDPYTDIEKHRKDFLEVYYGNAANEIDEYLKVLHQELTDSKLHFNWGTNDIVSILRKLTDDELSGLDNLWNAAKDKVSDDPVTLRHVERSMLSYRFYKMTAKRGEFADTSVYEEKKAELYEDCKKLGVIRYSEFELLK